MDIFTYFFVLSSDDKPISYDSVIPSFAVLALLMDMERCGLVTMDSKGKLTVQNITDSSPQSYKLLADAIKDRDSNTLKELLDHLLRHLTFRDLKEVLNAAINDIRVKDIAFFKDRIVINDNFRHEMYIKLINYLINDNNNRDGISVAALLYGCRLLKKYLDKSEYTSTAALIKSGISSESLPVTAFIVNNIDLIRGHIMGIVAN